MTPQEIAREAARQIFTAQLGARGGASFEETAYPFILTAAAKMVKESGAVEALEYAQQVLPHMSDVWKQTDAALEKLRAITEGNL